MPEPPLTTAVDLLLSMGQDVLGRDPDRALDCFREAAELARSLGSVETECRALQLSGSTEVGRGHYDEAEPRLERALSLARETDHDLLIATCLNALGLLRMKQGQTDDARVFLRESLSRTTESLQEEGGARVRADTLETLGLVDRETGEPSQAFLYYQEALETRRAAGDEPGIATCQNHLGSLSYRLGRFQESVSYYEAALERRRSLGDRHGTGSTANNLACTLMLQGKLKESATLFEESRRIAEDLGETRRLASILGNMGLLLSYQGRIDEAEEHLLESLRLHRNLKDAAGEAHALNNLANLAVERGQPEEAIRLADESVALWQQSGRRGNLAKPLGNKGEALLELGALRPAREAAEQALKAAEQARSDEYQAEAAALLAAICLKEGRLDDALDAAERSRRHAEASGSPQLTSASHTRLGHVHLERGDLEEAKLALEQASRLLRGIQHPYERARIMAEQGKLLARAGSPEAGAERLRRAAEEFRAMGNPRRRIQTLVALAPVLRASDPEQADAYRKEAREVARQQGLEEFLRTLEARRTPPPAEGADPSDGLVAALDEFTRALAAAASQRRDDPAELLEPLFELLQRHVHVQRAEFRWSDAATQWHADSTGDPAERSLSRGSDTDAAEPWSVLLGLPGESIGTLSLTRASPFRPNEIRWLESVARIMAIALQGTMDRWERAAAAQSQAPGRTTFEGFVGASRPMRDVYRLIEQVAPNDSVALLLGETGTGKELAARAIHERSPRSAGPFVAINCPSIPRDLIESELFGHERGAFTGADTMRPGKVELADGGTLFLDEVGDMSLATQVKLLRFLEEREFQRVGGRKTLSVDVRILAATSRHLKDEIEKGTFREDLYYRLNVVPVRMPSLRERKEDLPALATHLLLKMAEARKSPPRRISAGAQQLLTAYDWPGNVRELRNTLEYMATLGKEALLDERLVPKPIRESVGRGIHGESAAAGNAAALRPGETMESRLQQLEATLLRATLESEDWNQSAAARRLGITESKIRNRMRQYGIRRRAAPDSQ